MKLSPDEDQAARTAWGEARGEGALGMLWVLCAIRNRIDDPWVLETKRLYHGQTVEEVVTRPGQFDCWRKGDPNRRKLLHAEEYDMQAYETAAGLAVAVFRSVVCPMPGITHYYNPDVVARPAWANPPAIPVELPGQGKHRFYRHVY